jgi:hypothetical protein
MFIYLNFYFITVNYILISRTLIFFLRKIIVVGRVKIMKVGSEVNELKNQNFRIIKIYYHEKTINYSFGRFISTFFCL